MRGSRRLWWCAIPLVMGSCLAVADEPDPDLFRSETAGLELRKPAGWHFQSMQAALESRAQAKLKDEEFQKRMEQMATTPLVIASKHPEPYEKLNPSFQVLVRPAGPLEGETGADILRIVEPTLKTQFADYRSIEEIRDVTIAGQQAGRMTIRYTLKTQDGPEFPTQATILMIPRGKLLYQLSFSGPWEGPDALGSEIEDVLRSVKLLD